MKRLLKKIFMPIFLSILCGGLCGRLMFSIYEDKGNNILSSNKVYLLLDNSYDDYDTMKASTISSNYIYYEDNGKYNAVVALTKNKDNINKIKKVYGKDLEIEEYLLNNDEINNKLNSYDKKLEEANDNELIKSTITDMINIYKDKEDIKMAKIS